MRWKVSGSVGSSMSSGIASAHAIVMCSCRPGMRFVNPKGSHSEHSVRAFLECQIHGRCHASADCLKGDGLRLYSLARPVDDCGGR